MRAARRLAAVLVCAALGACASAEDYLSNINPFATREPRITGERRPVGAEPAIERAAGPARPVTLAAAVNASDWLNPGGPPSNAAPNALLSRGTLWRAAGAAEGRAGSAPIVADGRVVVFDTRRVAAFAIAGGQPLWSVPAEEGGTGTAVGGGGIASDGRIVYAATGLRRLFAVDVQTGRIVWSRAIPEPARSAPTVAGGRIFLVSAGGTVFAFSTNGGAELWRYSAGSTAAALASTTSPAVAGETVIVPLGSGDLVGLDAARGTPRWSGLQAGTLERSPNAASLGDIAGRPVIDRGIVFAGGVGGRVLAARVETGQILWERAFASVHAPAISGEGVFVLAARGEVTALDRANGQVRWTTPLPAGEERAVWAGPTLAGSTLWVASNRGVLVGLDARDGRITTRREIGEGAGLPPIAAAGRLIVATQRGGLVALD